MIHSSIRALVILLFISQFSWAQNWQFIGPEIPVAGSNGSQLGFDTANNIFIKYIDDAGDGQWKIKKLSGDTWTNVSSVRRYTVPSFSFAGWLCGPQSGWTGGVKVFDGYNWNWLGDSTVLEPPALWGADCSVDNHGNIYLIGGCQAGISIYKYNGSAWNIVGAPFFANHTGGYYLSFDRLGTPFLIFQDVNFSYHVSIMKFDGSNWVYVGNPGFANGIHTARTGNSPMVIDSTGKIFVAYQENSSFGSKVSVISYDGVSYSYVGTRGISSGPASDAILAFDSLGDLYLAYYQHVGQTGLRVLKLINGVWVPVGDPNVRAEPVSLLFDRYNKLYISQGRDYVRSGYIRKYDNNEYFNIINYSPDTVCEGQAFTVTCSSNVPFDSLTCFKLFTDPCTNTQTCYTGFINFLSDSVKANPIGGDTFTLTFQLPHGALDTMNGLNATYPLSVLSYNPNAQTQTTIGKIFIEKGPDFTDIPDQLTVCHDSIITLMAGSSSHQNYQWYFIPTDTLISNTNSVSFPCTQDGKVILLVQHSTTGCLNSDTSQIIDAGICVNTDIEDVNGLSAKVFPNPTADLLEVIIDETHSGAQLSIYNLTGVLMQTVEMQTGHYKLDIGSYPIGVYIAQIKTKDACMKRRWIKK